MARLRRYLAAGLLIWVPVGVTVAVVGSLVTFMDGLLLILPPSLQPEHWLGRDIPGLGVVLVVAVVLATGVVAANLLGQRLVRVGESVLGRIPLVRSLYSGVKQLLESLMSGTGSSFRKVVLVQYPRVGIWTLAFQTGEGLREAVDVTGEDLVSVYVPTTPNPTSGFFLMIPRAEVVELKITVDEGLRMILSMGMVMPGSPRKDALTAAHRAAV
ncbi:MAG TPA: DUF502 domain-containing protein [Acidiferrobacter sp.]|nr:DUF502 domain-containing protein [Acidiferrobacter sp.]